MLPPGYGEVDRKENQSNGGRGESKGTNDRKKGKSKIHGNETIRWRQQ
jgi:hypothetical protein